MAVPGDCNITETSPPAVFMQYRRGRPPADLALVRVKSPTSRRTVCVRPPVKLKAGCLDHTALNHSIKRELRVHPMTDPHSLTRTKRIKIRMALLFLTHSTGTIRDVPTHYSLAIPTELVLKIFQSYRISYQSRIAIRLCAYGPNLPRVR